MSHVHNIGGYVAGSDYAEYLEQVKANRKAERDENARRKARTRGYDLIIESRRRRQQDGEGEAGAEGEGSPEGEEGAEAEEGAVEASDGGGQPPADGNAISGSEPDPGLDSLPHQFYA
jgi:hypothetical protein